jgi:hypothetical protein
MRDLFSPSHHHHHSRHHHHHHHHHSTTTNTKVDGVCSDADVSMDDDGHSVTTSQTINNNNSNDNNNTSINTSNECMSIASPPRTVLRTAHRRPLSNAVRTGGFRSRLFQDDDEEEEEHHDHQNLQLPRPPVLDRKPSPIKPLSLHLDFVVTDNVDTENQLSYVHLKGSPYSQGPPLGHSQQDSRTFTSATTTTAAASFTAPNKTPRRPLTGSVMRKRHAEPYELYTKQLQTAQPSLSFDRSDGTDEDVFSAAESPVDMYASPRISPASPSSRGSRSSNNQSRGTVEYRSPSLPRQPRDPTGSCAMISHKSPSSFLTLDGRTVQSKNPFSPMNFEEHPTPRNMMDTYTHFTSSARAKMQLRTSSASPSKQSSLFLNMDDTSLSLPTSLNGRNNGGSAISGSSGDGGCMLRPRHTLQHKKRDSSNTASEGVMLSMEGVDVAPIHLSPQPHQQRPLFIHLLDHEEQKKQMKESYYTRDGYPERTGRYSFTGSPIKEHTEIPATATSSGKHRTTSTEHLLDVGTNSHKIRRRTKGDDVVVAAAAAAARGAHDDLSWQRRGMLHVQTNLNNDNHSLNQVDQQNNDDTISPTDVTNFPLFRPASSSSHARKTTLPPTPSKPVRRGHQYTPIRKRTGPPPPPMPAIRRARSFDEDDFDDDDDDDNVRRHSSSNAMDYLSLSPGGEGGQFQVVTTTAPTAVPAVHNCRFYSDFDVISELGNGSFGNVYKVLSRLDGCMYAIKVAHRPAKGVADRDRMLKEVYALASLSDQADTATFHIVRYHQAWMEDHRLYIQTELCTTTLQAEMQQAAPVPLSLWRRYKCLREILLALEFIHKNGMVHLDIKPENIFVRLIGVFHSRRFLAGFSR